MEASIKKKELEVLICIALAKLFSEQSTYLIDELRQDKKQWFNLSVNAIDTFIKLVEKDLSEYNLETLNIMVDSLHDGMATFRKELLNAKEHV